MSASSRWATPVLVSGRRIAVTDGPPEREQLTQLADGIQRFRRDIYPQRSELFNRLSSSQSPGALFITCSDSRILPNLITQTDPGDLFHCRTIGNLVPPFGEEAGGVASAVEYAVGALKVKSVVVCGHSDCGAMKGVLHPENLAPLPATAKWLRYAQTVEKVRQTAGANGASDEKDHLRRLTEANVVLQLDHLQTHPTVKDGLERGELEIFGLVYDIGAGSVVSYDAWSKRFLPVERDVMACATPPEYLKRQNGSSPQHTA